MTPDEAETRARSRFHRLSGLRLFGALLMVAGFLVTMGRLDIAGPDLNRVIGVIMVLIGAFGFAVAPVLLARRWKRSDRR